MPGHLEVITGVMFAGKTEELLRRIHRLRFTKTPYLLFKPITDTRSGQGRIKSNGGNEKDAIDIPVEDPFALLDILAEMEREQGRAFKVVGIDEIQFFPAHSPILRVIQGLVKSDYRVIAAGLDLDFRGEPFGVTPEVLALADEVLKLTAVCMVCGGAARYPQRLINGEPAPYNAPQIQVGGAETYEARCRNCFVLPNVPHEVLNPPRPSAQPQ